MYFAKNSATFLEPRFFFNPSSSRNKIDLGSIFFNGSYVGYFEIQNGHHKKHLS